MESLGGFSFWFLVQQRAFVVVQNFLISSYTLYVFLSLSGMIFFFGWAPVRTKRAIFTRILCSRTSPLARCSASTHVLRQISTIPCFRVMERRSVNKFGVGISNVRNVGKAEFSKEAKKQLNSRPCDFRRSHVFAISFCLVEFLINLHCALILGTWV